MCFLQIATIRPFLEMRRVVPRETDELLKVTQQGSGLTHFGI